MQWRASLRSAVQAQRRPESCATKIGGSAPPPISWKIPLRHNFEAPGTRPYASLFFALLKDDIQQLKKHLLDTFPVGSDTGQHLHVRWQAESQS